MINSDVLNMVRDIAGNYPEIHRVILFGSRARGDFGEKSDYDIAIDARGMDFACKSRFTDEIDDIDTLYKIDLVFLENASVKLAENIKRDGIVIMDKFKTKLENYKHALARLCEAVAEFGENPSLTVRDGAIQRFEFTAELAWKTVREYLIREEVGELNSPKNVMSEAFRCGIVDDERGWLGILRDRNLTSHIYDDGDVAQIYERVEKQYITLFKKLAEKLESTGE